MKYWMNVLLAVASTGLLVACGGGSESPATAPTERTLAVAAAAEPSASEFMKLAQAAGTTQRMGEAGQLTLIAPSNEALAEMRADIDELMLPENRAQLQTFVESHLVAKRMLASDMQTGSESSLTGNTLEVHVGAGFIALFFPQVGANAMPALLLWLAAGLLVTYLAFSVLSVTHQAWGARLGGDSVQRSRVVAWREGCGLFGVLAASVLPSQFGMGAASAVLVAALAAGMLLLARAPRAPTRGEHSSGHWALPWRSHRFRSLLTVFMLNGIASAVPATLVLFFVRDRLQAPDLEALFLGAYFAAAALSIPLWIRTVRWFGLARAWLGAMGLAVAAFAWVLTLGAGDGAGFFAVCIASGVALGADLIIPGALLTGGHSAQRPRRVRRGCFCGLVEFGDQAEPRPGSGCGAAAAVTGGLCAGSARPPGLAGAQSGLRRRALWVEARGGRSAVALLDHDKGRRMTNPFNWAGRGLRRVAAGAATCLAALVLAGCAGPQIADYAAQRPAFDFKQYFNGRLVAHGLVSDRSGVVLRRFVVTMRCAWVGDSGTLDEQFVYDDGELQQRVWRVRVQADGTFIGTAADVVGQATGAASGSAFRWNYTLKVPARGSVYELQFDDWLHLIDERTLINKATMSKFGVRVGEVLLSFTKL